MYEQKPLGMGTFGFTEAKRREPLPFILRGPFAPAQVSKMLLRVPFFLD